MCTGARGHSMIPWPNRIRGGAYTWAGRQYQLDVTEPDMLGAIHGLTRWASWRYLGGTEDSALRDPQPLGHRHIDVSYTDLCRDADGRARVRLAAPRGRAVTLWVHEGRPTGAAFKQLSLSSRRWRPS
ncbi:aldose epimerase family protein [Streptomyces cynarae]|uniref:aldose epimerase family protein n=1 Tax=Streptomyces cynarae TaxID=2981134 RepID=UPI0036F1F450